MEINLTDVQFLSNRNQVAVSVGAPDKDTDDLPF